MPERGVPSRRPDQPDSPYRSLLAALDRLSQLLHSSKGRSNREIKTVTEQLNAIADWWERE